MGSDLLGVRLMCSGRIQGAEMARVEVRSFYLNLLHKLQVADCFFGFI